MNKKKRKNSVIQFKTLNNMKLKETFEKCSENKMKLQKQELYVLTIFLFVLYLYKSLGHSTKDKHKTSKKVLKKCLTE